MLPHNYSEFCVIKQGKELLAKRFFLGAVLEYSSGLLSGLPWKTLQLTKLPLSVNSIKDGNQQL